MKRRGMIIGVSAACILIGILISRISIGSVRENVSLVEANESGNIDDVEKNDASEKTEEWIPWEFKTQEPVASGLKNTSDCYLCGENDRSLMPYFRKFDDLGVICLNTWYVLDMQIRNHDEEGNFTGPQNQTPFGYVRTGEKSCFFRTSGNPDRGISEMKINIEENSYFNVKNVKEHLCQECLDKVLESLETYGPEGENIVPYDLCLVDFQTLEVYPLQYNRSYYVRDYYVCVEMMRMRLT